MEVATRDLKLRVKPWEYVDLTPEIKEVARGLRHGVINVFTPSEGCAVITIEYEPALLLDLKKYIEEYLHARGIRHLTTAILGCSVTLPVIDGRLRLGTWQQVVLVNADDREKGVEIYVTAVGEGRGAGE